MSEKPDLLTELVFQRSSVSKKPDLLTKQRFQVSSVCKNGDLLTGDSFLSYYGERLRDYVLMWKQSGADLEWEQFLAVFLRFVLSEGERLRGYV